MEAHPTEIAHSELLSGAADHILEDETHPMFKLPEDKYWQAQAAIYKIELQNCNKGLNRLNRQNRRLKREKAELADFIADQIIEIRVLRKALKPLWTSMDELKR